MEELNSVHVKNFNSDLFNYNPLELNNLKDIWEEIKEADFYLIVKKGECKKSNNYKDVEKFDKEKELIRNIRIYYKNNFNCQTNCLAFILCNYIQNIYVLYIINIFNFLSFKRKIINNQIEELERTI